MNRDLEVKVTLQVLKSPHEVFEAIVDPEQMSRYFIWSGSDRMQEGKDVTWQFSEFEQEQSGAVRVQKLRDDEFVSFSLTDIHDGLDSFVEISLRENGTAATVITLTERSKQQNDRGVSWLKRETEGWAYFLVFLKAYLEYGITLNRTAFDFRQNDAPGD